VHEAPSWLAGPKISMYVGWFVCASAPVTCAIITSHTLLPCLFALVDLTATLRTGVAAMSSLAQLQVRDTKKQRQHGHKEVRLTKSRNGRGEQLLVMSAGANQLTMAARKPLNDPAFLFLDMKY